MFGFPDFWVRLVFLPCSMFRSSRRFTMPALNGGMLVAADRVRTIPAVRHQGARMRRFSQQCRLWGGSRNLALNDMLLVMPPHHTAGRVMFPSKPLTSAASAANMSLHQQGLQQLLDIVQCLNSPVARRQCSDFFLLDEEADALNSSFT